MSRPKIHFLYDSRLRFGSDPIECQYHALCPVYQTAHLNPDTTTWRPKEVTCKGCRNRLVGVKKVSDFYWDVWLRVNTCHATADGGLCGHLSKAGGPPCPEHKATTENSKFGRSLRNARSKAGKTMGELARHLGVSTPYLSDVERDRRAPLTSAKIKKAAEFLGIDPGLLLGLSASHRGRFELSTSVSARGQAVGAALAREWETLSEDDFDQLQNFLNGLVDRVLVQPAKATTSSPPAKHGS